ncbi:MAG: hypothetical protein ACHQ51_15635, partial [Elusimicrobiota bacterium]
GSDASDASPAPQGGRDIPAEHAQLMKELGLEDNSGAGTTPLTPEKIKILQGALARQGASPAIRAALDKVANGQGKMTEEESQALMKSMKLDEIDPSQLTPSAAPSSPPDAP